MMRNIKSLITTLVAITVIMIIAKPQAVMAATANKILSAELGKDYVTAKFNLTFEQPGEYDIKIYGGSDGNKYTANQTSPTEANCVVQNAKQGKWTIDITKNDVDDSIDTTAEDVIGNVHIEIQGSTQEAVDGEKDIKVAADISGLKMYFRDDTFVAEWAESNKGSLYIEIIDAKSQEKIASETTQDYKYEVEIDTHLHSNIVVTVVPTESTGINNAERRWTMTTSNNPEAGIEFPTNKIINWDTLPIKVSLGKPYRLVAYLNNRIILETEVLQAGEYEYPLETDIDNNSYIVYVVDPESGYMRSYPHEVVKDVVAPAIRLNQSYENISTGDSSIIISGSIDKDYSKFTVNDSDVRVEGDHSFQYEYELKDGINNIRLYASDEAGNVSEYMMTVTRTVPGISSGSGGGSMTFVIVIVIIGAAAFMLFKKPAKNVNITRKPEKNGGSGHGFRKPTQYGVIDEKLAFVLRILIPLAFLYITLTYIVQLTTVASGSMEPKLPVGNLAVYNRLAYKKHTPQRGDIITFHSEEFNQNLAKRVIGIPGDHIEFIDGYVFINGQYADETEYIQPDVETNCNKSFDVPANTVFVLGDNRENSYDSRFWNEPYIPYNTIEGKYMGQSAFNPRYILRQIL